MTWSSEVPVQIIFPVFSNFNTVENIRTLYSIFKTYQNEELHWGLKE